MTSPWAAPPELKKQRIADASTSNGRNQFVATVIYKTLPVYRIPFFEALRPHLRSRGVELRLIYGQPPPGEAMKQDTGHIAWAQPVRNRIFIVGSRKLYWQPCLSLLKDSDLVIVEQASKLLINYVLLAKQRLGKTKVAMWGHGRNFMENSASSIGELVKRLISRRAHWWFAYNESSAAVVRDLGFPAHRITVVQNTIDTELLQKKKAATTTLDIEVLRRDLNLRSVNVGIFVGGLYAEKRIEFLLQAAREIRKRVPDFELLVVGAGPQADIVRKAAHKAPWIHYIGPKFNEESVPFLMLSKVMLLPGAVGLAVIDSFVVEVPLVTVDGSSHGPEIEYLVHGINGLKLDRDTSPEDYAQAVVGLLKQDRIRSSLQEGCRIAAEKYTLSAMVERFTEGVIRALSSG